MLLVSGHWSISIWLAHTYLWGPGHFQAGAFGKLSLGKRFSCCEDTTKNIFRYLNMITYQCTHFDKENRPILKFSLVFAVLGTHCGIVGPLRYTSYDFFYSWQTRGGWVWGREAENPIIGLISQILPDICQVSSFLPSRAFTTPGI